MKKSLVVIAVGIAVAGGYAAYRWATDSQAASTEQAISEAGAAPDCR
jgi:hypothetical protein